MGSDVWGAVRDRWTGIRARGRADALPRFAVLALAALFASPAMATDITVTLTVDPTPDGCATNGCSLREAVSLANSLSGPDRIFLPAGMIQVTRDGADEDANVTGDIDVLDDLEIIGAGAASTTVIQLATDRVFDLRNPSVVTFRNFRIEGGNGVDLGGGIRAALNPTLTLDGMVLATNSARLEGGALFHEGTTGAALPRLVLNNTVFDGNTAAGPFPHAYGGAVYMGGNGGNQFYFSIDGCTFQNNQAADDGGALLIEGNVTQAKVNGAIKNTVISNNTAQGGQGGALALGTVNGGIVNIRVAGSTFQDNAAAGAGGAISGNSISRIDNSVFLGNTAATGGAVQANVDRIEDSAFCDNHAITEGGAIRATGSMTIRRSTFCNNLLTNTTTANDTVGGGAIRFDPGGGQSLLIERSTFDANEARVGGALSVVSGDVRLRGVTMVAPASPPAGSLGTLIRYASADAGPTWNLSNTLLIGTCSYAFATPNPDVTSNNIESGGDSCRLTSSFMPIANQVNVPAGSVGLGALADNGGPTSTRLPLAGSLMLTAGSNSSCIVPDQRGLLVADSQCDVGAAELDGGPTDLLFADGFD